MHRFLNRAHLVYSLVVQPPARGLRRRLVLRDSRPSLSFGGLKGHVNISAIIRKVFVTGLFISGHPSLGHKNRVLRCDRNKIGDLAKIL